MGCQLAGHPEQGPAPLGPYFPILKSRNGVKLKIFQIPFNSRFCMMTLGLFKSPAIPQGPPEQPQNFLF